MFPISQKKNVVLISSLHHDDNIDKQSGKPEIIIDYNNTKGGVDVVDRLCANYNVARNTRRWPMVIFYSILNLAGINSFVVFCSNNPNSTQKRRGFLRTLALELIKPHLSVRSNLQTIPRTLRNRLQEISGTPDTAQAVAPPNQQTGRCAICSSRKSRKTRFFCRKCYKYMCLEHIGIICNDCFEN